MYSESVIGNGRSWIPYRTTMKLKHHFQKYFSYIWWSVLLMEETRVPGENLRPAASHQQTLSHNVVSNSQCQIDSYKSIYHAITTMMAPTTQKRIYFICYTLLKNYIFFCIFSEMVFLITSLVEVQKAFVMLFSCLYKVYLINRSISIISGVLVIFMALFR